MNFQQTAIMIFDDKELPAVRCVDWPEIKGVPVWIMEELPTKDPCTMACCAFFDDDRPSLIMLKPEVLNYPHVVISFILRHEYAHTTQKGKELYRAKDIIGLSPMEEYCDRYAAEDIGALTALEALAFLAKIMAGKTSDIPSRYKALKQWASNISLA